MTFKTALAIAEEVKKENPEYILCGSVALILAGVIPEREVGDIDFIAPPNYVNEKLKDYIMNYPGFTVPQNKTGYKTYKQDIVLNDLKGFYYNVFVPDFGNIKTQVVNGITIQDTNTILKYKTLYAREKDLADLSKVKYDR